MYIINWYIYIYTFIQIKYTDIELIIKIIINFIVCFPVPPFLFFFCIAFYRFLFIWFVTVELIGLGCLFSCILSSCRMVVFNTLMLPIHSVISVVSSFRGDVDASLEGQNGQLASVISWKFYNLWKISVCVCNSRGHLMPMGSKMRFLLSWNPVRWPCSPRPKARTTIDAGYQMLIDLLWQTWMVLDRKTPCYLARDHQE